MKRVRLHCFLRIIAFITMMGCGTEFSLAQYHENPMFGLRLGCDYSQIANLTNMLVYDENKPTYNFTDKTGVTPSASLFAHYRFYHTQMAIEGSLNYNQIASDIEKISNITSSIERFNLKYQYFGVGLFTKVYLYRGFNLGVGTGVGMCLNGSSGITYQSSTGSMAQNLQSQEHIRQALKGRANVTAGAVLGYEFKFGLSVQAACFYGLTDLIETGVNPYKFTECKNNARTLQFTIGWAISEQGFYF